jgi:hypothetical protein
VTSPSAPAAATTATAADGWDGVRRDTRPRRVRLAAPVGTAVAAVAVVAYLGAVDPNEPGHYPLCPTRAAFGVDCPGCGSLRALHALAHGDLARSADHNLLLVAVLPFLVWWWVAWLRRSWTGVTPPVSARTARWRARGTIALLVVVLAFGVLRNVLPYLGSAAG